MKVGIDGDHHAAVVSGVIEAGFQDHRNHEVFLVGQMTVEHRGEGAEQVVEFPQSLARGGFVLKPGQNVVRPCGESIKVVVQGVMVGIQNAEPTLQPAVKGDELGEVVRILDLMMTMQLIEEEPSEPRQARSVAGHVEAAVDSRLGLVRHLAKKLAEHQVPFQPELDHAAEIGVSFPRLARDFLNEDAKGLRKACPRFESEIVVRGHPPG
jgi:hypothetical protein